MIFFEKKINEMAIRVEYGFFRPEGKKEEGPV
jgi:hypothetical protein